VIDRLSRQAHRSVCRLVTLCAVCTVGVAMLAGCGSSEPVCQGAAQTNVLLVSTGDSDLAVGREMAPEVAHEVVERTAKSCGRLLVGLADNHPEADLVLRSLRFTPQNQTAYNRTPDVSQMISEGANFVQQHLLQPLKSARPSAGGAFLGTLVAVGDELHAEGIGPANVIFIGDGIEDEPAPTGRWVVNFGAPLSAHGDISPAITKGATAFEPLLSRLGGSCVMLIGAGARSALSDSQILTAQSLFQETLATAHIGFAATRSPDIPPGCKAAPALSIKAKSHNVVATLFSDLAFQLDSAQLQPTAVQTLKRLVPSLRNATSVSVSGYTDSTGSDEINGPLSWARARTVAQWLATQTSFPVNRMEVHGFGSKHPIASNVSPQGRATNRRVVIRIKTR
jgi:outer membrane protein OmpA-like peptidoglycan-associated protein